MLDHLKKVSNNLSSTNVHSDVPGPFSILSFSKAPSVLPKGVTGTDDAALHAVLIPVAKNDNDNDDNDNDIILLVILINDINDNTTFESRGNQSSSTQHCTYIYILLINLSPYQLINLSPYHLITSR